MHLRWSRSLGLDDGALVAIAEGVGQGRAGGVEAHVIDGPAVYGYGANAFGGEFGALAHALFDAGDNVIERIPAEAAVDLAGTVREAMDEGKLDGRMAVFPAEQGDATAFGAEVDCDRGAQVSRLEWLVERSLHRGTLA